MSGFIVKYCHPLKHGTRYYPDEGSFFVNEENICDIVSLPNDIDYFCDAMRVVLCERCKNMSLSEMASSFLYDLNIFNDQANQRIIDSYFEDKKSNDDEPRILDLREISLPLMDRFINIYNRKLW